MHVEFFGPPGSGKSTIASALSTYPNIEMFERRVVNQIVSNKFLPRSLVERIPGGRLKCWYANKLWLYRYRMISIYGLLFDDPDLLFQIIRISNCSTRNQDILRKNHLDIAAKFSFISDSTLPVILVVDEGLIQYAVTAIEGSSNSGGDLLNEYLDTIELPDLSFKFNCSSEEILLRQKTREKGKVSTTTGLTDMEAITRIDKDKNYHMQIAKALRNRGCEVIDIDTEGEPVDAVANQIHKHISEYRAVEG